MTALRWHGNAFLLLFSLDAVLTVFAAVTGRLVVLQGLVALGVILQGMLTVGIWVCTRRLPASVFGPPLLFLLWVMLLAMPLPLWVSLERLQRTTGLLQMFVAAGMLARVAWLEGGRTPWLREGGVLAQAAPLRLGQRLARAALVVGGLPLAVALYGVGSLAYTVSHTTHDFVRLGLRGISVAHRTYVRADQEIHLIGMIHIGEEAAYSRLFASIPPERSLVLAEGVTDRQGLLYGEGVPDGAGAGADTGQDLSYAKVAARLNLSVQGDIQTLTRAPIRLADIDVADFSPRTRQTIARIGEIFDADDGPAFLSAYMALSEAIAQDPTLMKGLFADILDRRNRHLTAEIDDALETWPVVVVPWGAYHLRDIEVAVQERGFQPSAEERVTLIRYAALLSPASNL